MYTDSIQQQFQKIADKVSQTIRQEWQDLQSEWAPEREEAAKRFEQLKSRFSAILKELEKEVGQSTEKGKEDLQRLIQELRVQLALGKAETLEAYEEQKENITRQWHKLRASLAHTSTYHQFQEQLMDWRVKLDLLRVQYALSKMDLKSDWKEISSRLKKEFGHIEKTIESGAGIASEKIDQLEAELRVRLDKVFGKS